MNSLKSDPIHCCWNMLAIVPMATLALLFGSGPRHANSTTITVANTITYKDTPLTLKVSVDTDTNTGKVIGTPQLALGAYGISAPLTLNSLTGSGGAMDAKKISYGWGWSTQVYNDTWLTWSINLIDVSLKYYDWHLPGICQNNAYYNDGYVKIRLVWAGVTIWDGVYSENMVVCGPQFTNILGDANNDGVVNIADANAIAEWTVGITTHSIPYMSQADVSLDGKVDIVDAMMIGQYTEGQRTLPTFQH